MAKYTQNEANRYNNLEIWQLNNFEICTFLHYPRDESEQSIYKLNIAAIMSQIPVAKPNSHQESISKSIYANDSKCSLPVGTRVTVRNYVEVTKRANEHFNHRWLDFGAKIYVETVNGDIDGMQVTSRLDPSYCDSCITQHPYYYNS